MDRDEIIQIIKLNAKRITETNLCERTFGCHIDRHIGLTDDEMIEHLNNKPFYAVVNENIVYSSFDLALGNVHRLIADAILNNIDTVADFIENTMYNPLLKGVAPEDPLYKSIAGSQLPLRCESDRVVGHGVFYYSNMPMNTKQYTVYLGTNMTHPNQPFNVISASPSFSQEMLYKGAESIVNKLDQIGYCREEHQDDYSVIRRECPYKDLITDLTKRINITPIFRYGIAVGLEQSHGEKDTSIIITQGDGNTKRVFHHTENDGKTISYVNLKSGDLMVKSKVQDGNLHTELYRIQYSKAKQSWSAFYINECENGKWKVPPQKIYLDAIDRAEKVASIKMSTRFYNTHTSRYSKPEKFMTRKDNSVDCNSEWQQRKARKAQTPINVSDPER